MAEKTTLPLVLAEQTWPNVGRNVLALKHGDRTRDELSIAMDHYASDKDGGEKLERGFYIDGVDPAELMRNLAPFVPEVEPVAWVAADGSTWRPHLFGTRFSSDRYDQHEESLEDIAARYSDGGVDSLTRLYAHPPVTAEPAPDIASIVDEWLDEPVASGKDLLGRLALHGLAIVTAEPATAPRFDLVEGLNVEEWAHKADVEHQAFRNSSAVLDAAWEALKQHGFTSDTLESQTLAESIHALAGRGAPSVEQIAEVLAGYPVLSEVNASAIAEDIHALYGTGDAVDQKESGPTVDMYEPGSVVYLDGEVWVPGKDYDEKVAEVERCKAALEAAEAVITSIKAEATRRDAWHESKWSVAVAKDEMNAARDYSIWCTEQYDAARAAVEAETSEEAGA